MQCNYIFSYCIKFCRDVLRVHEKLHTSPALCRVCGKKFPEVKGLQAHTASVHAEKVYQCPRCRKQFAAETMLERHMLVAHSSQSAEFKCLPSGRQMANEAAVKTHVLAVHRETKASLQCPSCSKSFLRETQLQKHTELRHGPKASVARKPLQPPFSQQNVDPQSNIPHTHTQTTTRNKTHANTNNWNKHHHAIVLLSFYLFANSVSTFLNLPATYRRRPPVFHVIMDMQISNNLANLPETTGKLMQSNQQVNSSQRFLTILLHARQWRI